MALDLCFILEPPSLSNIPNKFFNCRVIINNSFPEAEFTIPFPLNVDVTFT